MEITEEQKRQLLKWRLILGKKSEAHNQSFQLPGLKDAGLGLGASSNEVEIIDDLEDCLSFLYDDSVGGAASRAAGLGASSPHVHVNLNSWLSKIRKLFSTETVAFVQKEAIEKKNLKSLLFEPESLQQLDRNIDLITTLINYKHLVPDKVKALAREIIKEIVENIQRRLENDVRMAVLSATRKNTHSPVRVLRNIDWKRTIRTNLKHYNLQYQRLIPERFYFWGNQRKHREWQVILLMDQSGSMGNSLVYSSIMASIFASINTLKTNLVFFDTEVVDMTDVLSDPVDLIFGARLGGGTDINKAVLYGISLIEQPEKTIFILISDLFEGGVEERLKASMQFLVESRVRSLCILALDDSGRPSFNQPLAKTFSNMGVRSFACSPPQLAEVLECIIKGDDFVSFVSKIQSPNRN